MSALVSAEGLPGMRVGRAPTTNIGIDAAFNVLAGLVGEAAAEAGIDARSAR